MLEMRIHGGSQSEYVPTAENDGPAFSRGCAFAGTGQTTRQAANRPSHTPRLCQATTALTTVPLIYPNYITALVAGGGGGRAGE